MKIFLAGYSGLESIPLIIRVLFPCGWKGKTGLEKELKERMTVFLKLVRDMNVEHLMRRVNEQVREI